MFCRQCGTELEEGVKFCTNCGTPVAQAERQDKQRVQAPKEHKYTSGTTHLLTIQMAKPTALTNPDVAVEINPCEISAKIKGGETLNYDLPEGKYTVRFKCSFRKTSIEIDLYGDSTVSAKWNMITGHLEAENSTSFSTKGRAEQSHSNTSESTYPVVAVCPNAGIYALLCAVLVIALIVAGNWIGRMFGYASRWTFRMFATFSGIAVVRFLGLMGKKQYIVPCPHCGQEFGFPVSALGIECPKCKKRIIIVNGVARCADSG